VDVAAVLWFDANEDEMTARILKRAETSGRNDDNIETLKKRFAQFNNEQLPIIERFAAQGKVIKLNAM
jgi:UMP-CMP kinase